MGMKHCYGSTSTHIDSTSIYTCQGTTFPARNPGNCSFPRTPEVLLKETPFPKAERNMPYRARTASCLTGRGRGRGCAAPKLLFPALPLSATAPRASHREATRVGGGSSGSLLKERGVLGGEGTVAEQEASSLRHLLQHRLALAAPLLLTRR